MRTEQIIRCPQLSSSSSGLPTHQGHNHSTINERTIESAAYMHSACIQPTYKQHAHMQPPYGQHTYNQPTHNQAGYSQHAHMHSYAAGRSRYQPHACIQYAANSQHTITEQHAPCGRSAVRATRKVADSMRPSSTRLSHMHSLSHNQRA